MKMALPLPNLIGFNISAIITNISQRFSGFQRTNTKVTKFIDYYFIFKNIFIGMKGVIAKVDRNNKTLKFYRKIKNQTSSPK